ncbi:unnamed protein product [Phytophthora lilii]|uniref:Unnamed protein product n=1 Tax=Phytophthora lilii TaxID=2077276 RepID=A0A9W6WSV1_9STRA|nr:unnamed protein product [Phytophthora lilii]
MAVWLTQESSLKVQWLSTARWKNSASIEPKQAAHTTGATDAGCNLFDINKTLCTSDCQFSSGVYERLVALRTARKHAVRIVLVAGSEG